MLREELAWAAGFIDGEGHFGTHICGKARPTDQRQYAAVKLTVAQCNRKVLDRLQKALGFGRVFGPYKKVKETHTPFYMFSVTGFEKTQMASSMLWTWLGDVKKSQVTKALQEYLEFNKRPKLRLGPKPRVPTCHPNRKHGAHGLCESCYQISYRRKKNEK